MSNSTPGASNAVAAFMVAFVTEALKTYFGLDIGPNAKRLLSFAVACILRVVEALATGGLADLSGDKLAGILLNAVIDTAGANGLYDLYKKTQAPRG